MIRFSLVWCKKYCPYRPPRKHLYMTLASIGPEGLYIRPEIRGVICPSCIHLPLEGDLDTVFHECLADPIGYLERHADLEIHAKACPVYDVILINFLNKRTS